MKKIINKIVSKAKSMGKVSINGVVVSGDLVGGNIQICNDKITINGKDVTPDSKTVSIVVEGNVESLDIDYCSSITIEGDVHDAKTTSGDIECGNVKGNVNTVSGDVKCGKVDGSIKTVSGDIIHKR